MGVTGKSIVLAALLAGAVLAVAAFPHRWLIALRLYAWIQAPPPLSEAAAEPADVRWVDGYFTVERIDAQTLAIGEPRYWQQNYSYLVLGQERGILFDSGPGVRDIAPVVASLTSLPVTAVPSHLHFDHVGNHTRFERIALVDLPGLRRRAAAGVFRPSASEHLGFVEGFEPPELRVSEWWAPGSVVDLGGRALSVIHTPGHTPESISLFDADRGMLFTGDYLYEGPLFAYLPGSDLDAYLETARRLLATVPPETRLLTAHRETPPRAPVLGVADLAALRETLERVRAGTAGGEGLLLRSVPVNERVWLVTERWR